MNPKQLRLAILIIAVFLFTTMAWAGIPKTISYQGYLKQTNGSPVNSPTKIRFSLYSSNPHRDNPIWRETQTDVDVKQGVYSVQLGTVEPITAPFDIRYWLGVAFNDGLDMLPLQPLSSVPYSIKSGCNPGDMINCYTGTPGTMGTGICQPGLRTCPQDASGYGNCVGEVTPHPITGCNFPSCIDAFKNGAETDVDCGGGACPLCPNGKNCIINSDCQFGYCNSGICQTASCTDAVRNGAESDVDCGGGSCPLCAIGMACNTGSDCISGSCNKGVCIAPTCSDGIKNGTESDVDCGGVCANKCGLGKMCSINNDCNAASNNACASAICSSGFCSVEFVANGTLTVSQIAGDCQSQQCDGSGNIVSVPNNSDVPVDNNQCTADVCVSGVPSNPPQPSGTACNQDGGRVCDGSGICVACVMNANCPATGNQCTTNVCSGFSCGIQNLAVETTCNQGGTHCDGAGLCIP
jgi:hypothetical protein